MDFLSVVLPSAGLYCVADLTSRNKEHHYSADLSAAVAAGTKFAGRKHDTYFALATFVEEGKRTADNALFMRSVFMDIDCGAGKAYPTKQAAATALDEFLADTLLGQLGNPWIVSSGGGLHVYWPFERDVQIPEWRAAAENVKRLARAKGLGIDMTVTADAARVLRLPGSTNWKLPEKPRACKIMAEGSPRVFNFDEFNTAVQERVNGHAVALPGLQLPGVRPTRLDEESKVKLLSTTSVKFRDIMDKTLAGNGCEQVNYYINNAANDGMEPLWRGMLSIAKACEDGDKAAKKLSAMHPYTDARMEAKLREIKGPYPCTKFDSENPGLCQTCKFYGKITNPLAIGRELQVDNTEKVVEAPDEDGVIQPYVRPVPPKGFSYGKTGGVFVDKMDEDNNGNQIKRQFMVVSYDLFIVDILNVNGEHTVHLQAMRPDGPTRVTIPQKCITSRDETLKWLAQQNVMPAYGPGNGANLYAYIWASVEEASVNKRAVKVPDNYGWQPDGAFVFSGKVYTMDGAIAVPMLGLENVTKVTQLRGTLDGWRKVIDAFVARKAYDILSMLLVSFGAPLMRFTGLHGMTFHLGSTDTGTGKTVALQIAASVWGHPTHYRVGAGTSGVAMEHRLGLLGSLPLITDEITTKNRKDFEWFPGFLFNMTEGRGKERMESGANKERLNLSMWDSLTIMSSNTHVTDTLMSGRKHSSEGELRRVLEKIYNDKLNLSAQEVKVFRTLDTNCAVAGDAYAQWLVRNAETANAVTQRVYEKLTADFKAVGDERFWMAAISSMVAGGLLAGSKYAGIINLPMEHLVEELRSLVDKARILIRSNVRDADDVLNAYIREFYGKLVIVRAIAGSVQTTHGERGVVDESITKSEVRGRVEHDLVPGKEVLYLEEHTLRAFCSSMSFGYSDFKRQLEARYVVSYTRKDLLSKTRGPQMRVNVIKIERPESTAANSEDQVPVA